MRFSRVCTSSPDFAISFPSFPWEIVFGVTSGNLHMYLALRKCKNDCKILKIIRVPDFCPLIPELAADRLAHLLAPSVREVAGSNLCRTNTQGLKITEENVLPL